LLKSAKIVSGHYPRKGVGTALMNIIHSEAQYLNIPHLTSDMSKTAQPFFDRFEFVVVEHRKRILRGIEVPNALMWKNL